MNLRECLAEIHHDFKRAASFPGAFRLGIGSLLLSLLIYS